MKVQARMQDKVRIKNLKSLFAFFEKFGRVLEINIYFSYFRKIYRCVIHKFKSSFFIKARNNAAVKEKGIIF